jgi:RimJ/RimL family protein N-acetyltransferase
MQIHLEPLAEKHAAISWQWRNDAEVWKYTFNRPDREITPEIELEWVRKVIANPSDKRFAIYCDEVYVGNIYLTGIADGTSHFGIFIGDRTYWGKGVAKAATRLLLTKGREEFGLREVFLNVKKGNEAALKVYESLGFSVIADNGDAWRMRNNLNESP